MFDARGIVAQDERLQVFYRRGHRARLPLKRCLTPAVQARRVRFHLHEHPVTHLGVHHDGLDIGNLQATLRSRLTRPTSTHSTTRMLPTWSKHAPCGHTNLPGVKWSRVCLRKSPQVFAALSSPRFAITLFSRSIRVTRAPKSGITNSPCRSLKWHGKLTPPTKLSCLPSSVKYCSRALARSATNSSGFGPRRSTVMPCGQSNWPGSLPLPPN